jgi:DNA processing protein
VISQERIDWIRLARAERVGPRTFMQLLRSYGSASEAIDALPSLARYGGNNKPLAIPNTASIEQELGACARIGAHIVCAFETEYPELLRHTDDSPAVITIRGDTKCWQRPTLAIVGARNASANGQRFAATLAKELAAEGFTIVSGMARGIDTAAHLASVETGTVAVMAGGIDHIYPQENTKLYHSIVEKGAIIAELPYQAVPKAQHFPLRNRIISGISYGTIVVEAALGSGSLITARMALEQNRELFAVPGFPQDPRCQGTNKLIKDGAVLVGSAQDVLDVIIPLLANHKQIGSFATNSIDFRTLPLTASATAAELDQARQYVLQQLSASPIDLDTLVAMAELPVQWVMHVLLELELAGRLERHSGQRVALIYAQHVLEQQ